MKKFLIVICCLLLIAMVTGYEVPNNDNIELVLEDYTIQNNGNLELILGDITEAAGDSNETNICLNFGLSIMNYTGGCIFYNDTTSTTVTNNGTKCEVRCY